MRFKLEELSSRQQDLLLHGPFPGKPDPERGAGSGERGTGSGGKGRIVREENNRFVFTIIFLSYALIANTVYRERGSPVVVEKGTGTTGREIRRAILTRFLQNSQGSLVAILIHSDMYKGRMGGYVTRRQACRTFRLF